MKRTAIIIMAAALFLCLSAGKIAAQSYSEGVTGTTGTTEASGTTGTTGAEAGTIGTTGTTDLEIVVPEGYELVDSTYYVFAPTMDPELVGKNIFELLGESEMVLNESFEIHEGLLAHIDKNTEKALQGYRVRIFFDNKQTARAESEAVVERFQAMFHDVNVYRSYVNPYFKVTVGDFRTKSEAVQLLRRIRSVFPSAFVVRESIAYPIVDPENPVREATVKVLRPIE